MDDHELLRDYALHRSERAFAELVERHLPLVYATARRLVHDPAAAEDVAQTVFLQLARKAARVRPGALPGWLYHAAKCAAVDFLRREGCRRRQEAEAVKLAETNNEAVVSWDQLAPLVDDALSQLNPVDQSAILLRYFDGRSISETGRALDLSESAAQKRVSRALEKMRAYFARQGVTASAALLATTLGTQAATPPPAGLACKITGPSLAGAAGQAGGTGFFYLLLRILFMSTKTKFTLTIATTVVLIALTIAGFWWYSQPASAPVKIVFVSAGSTSPIDPKSSALHPPPQPMVPSPAQPHSPQPSASPTPPPTPPADLQSNLNTALADMARLVRTDGELAVMQTYMPPDLLAKADPQKIQAQKDRLAKVPQQMLQQMNEATAQTFESLTHQTPTFNTTGDEATFMLTRPGEDDPEPLVMVKINGKWYMKDPGAL